MEAPGQNGAIQIDEKWLKEWIRIGWERLDVFMGRQAAFSDYLDTHPNDESNALD